MKVGDRIKKLPKKDWKKAELTSLQGYIRTTYKNLINKLGKPSLPHGDGYKSDAEWNLIHRGHIITIYNYKTGKNYLGHSGRPVAVITDWHIGGHGPEAVSIIQEKFPSSIVNVM